MKRLFMCMLVIFSVLVFAGCNGSRQASPEDVTFLTCTDYWYHYDEMAGENEKMKFSKDFSFYWGCECGEPVGDSDVYELYDYDQEAQTIRLYNEFDDSSREIRVLDYSDYHLLLEIDGQVRDYTYMDAGLYIENSEKYLSGYNMYSSIIEGNAKAVVSGPFNYDGDVEYPDQAVTSYRIADEAQFFDLNIITTVKDGQELQEISYEEMTGEKAVSRMKDTAAFIWFNDEMEIKKILFYGATDIN